MGWAGWPPASVVIVTVVLGVIFEVVFCIGFWQFWTSGDVEDDPAATGAEKANETTMNETLNETLNGNQNFAEDPTQESAL